MPRNTAEHANKRLLGIAYGDSCNLAEIDGYHIVVRPLLKLCLGFCDALQVKGWMWVRIFRSELNRPIQESFKSIADTGNPVFPQIS